MVANFVEVFLARDGHANPVGINYLEKVQLPHLASIYGAMLAGVGAGVYRDIPTAAREVVSFDRTVGPDSSTHSRYLGLYDSWLRVYAAQLGQVEEGLLKPLWRAAGT